MPFPKIPYLMYKTPLKFDRIRNQSAVFLYQGFIDYMTNDFQNCAIAIQNVIPDMTIEVRLQKSILAELDLMGINKNTIYGDSDSTAQYINSKLFD